VFPVELDSFTYWVLVLELLKIFAQNLHSETILLQRALYIYILVLEDVIGSDVRGRFFGLHCIYSADALHDVVQEAQLVLG